MAEAITRHGFKGLDVIQFLRQPDGGIYGFASSEKLFIRPRGLVLGSIALGEIPGFSFVLDEMHVAIIGTHEETTEQFQADLGATVNRLNMINFGEPAWAGEFSASQAREFLQHDLIDVYETLNNFE